MTCVLNLYAGLGGNRAGWPADVRVVAVEQDPQIAEAYATLWPDDEVIVADAHQFLLDTITEPFDLRWSSPPCQSHSKLNRFVAGRSGKYRYPELDMLYGEILVMGEFVKTPWVVENVIPYYTPLIPPTTMMGRHYVWSNQWLPMISHDQSGPKIARDRKARGRHVNRTLNPMECGEVGDFEQAYGLALPACADGWGRLKRRQVMRNCVDPVIGKTVWDAIFHHDQAVQSTLLEAVQ